MYNELVRSNLRTIFKVITDQDIYPLTGRTFLIIFLAFGPCIQIFQIGLCPLLTINGTHLKGRYERTFLIAYVADEDNGIMPIAYIVAE